MTPLAFRNVGYWRFQMEWKKLVGRILSFVCAGALLVFALIGVTPPWYAGALALIVPIVNIVIGQWAPPD